MVQGEVVLLAGTPDYFIYPLIAELNYRTCLRINQMIMLPGLEGLFILCLASAELVPDHQLAVEEQVNCVVECSP